MNKVAFIGAHDKTDFLLYVARILSSMEKRILVVDATIAQKAKYIVPVLRPTSAYITEYDGVDVAVGFKDFDDIISYLGIASEAELTYEYCLIDVDNYPSYNDFNAKESVKKFFVTSFDLYSLKKGVEALSGLEEPTAITKILFAKNYSKEEDEYLEFLAMNYNVEWDKEYISVPFDSGELTGIIENQRVSQLNFKNLSATYKSSLQQVVEAILNDAKLKFGEVGKSIRKIEKGV